MSPLTRWAIGPLVSSFSLLLLQAPIVSAAPTKTVSSVDAILHSLESRNFFKDLFSQGGPVKGIGDLVAKAASVVAAVKADTSGGAPAFAGLLKDIVPSPAPTSIEQVISIAGNIPPNQPKDIISNSLRLKLQGVCVYDASTLLNGVFGPESSIANNNPQSPSSPVFPKRDPSDAPYSVSESQLRAAIQIPAGFTRGGKQPVILVPGTAAPAGLTYAKNFVKLLSASTFGDPVWLNIPGISLGDAQVTAEYVAYAIAYISGISNGSKVGIISWSQGSLNTQWALKYWPSLRPLVTDFIAVSGDFKGTLAADILCPAFPHIPCPPSVRQQASASNFVSTLRSGGGDSAYVPTTTIYSATDIIVTPQTGPGASGLLNGASNHEIQRVCAGKPAGGLYTHEGVLYHPLAWALVVDALTNDGPAKMERLDAGKICSGLATEGLGLNDVLAVESVDVVAAVEVLLHGGPVWAEPDIKAYAK